MYISERNVRARAHGSLLPRSFSESHLPFCPRHHRRRYYRMAVWEYNHYPLDIQMKAKPDHGMDLSGKRAAKGTKVFR